MQRNRIIPGSGQVVKGGVSLCVSIVAVVAIVAQKSKVAFDCPKRHIVNTQRQWKRPRSDKSDKSDP